MVDIHFPAPILPVAAQPSSPHKSPQRMKVLAAAKPLMQRVVSAPSEIDFHADIDTEHTVIAPCPKAVQDVKSKLVNRDAAAQVKPVLNTILLSEGLADALYKAEKKRYEDNPERPKPIPNKIVRTYDDNGNPVDVEYKISRVDTPEGLNAFILEPVDKESEIKVVFVGTKDLPGVVRDMEDEAAGQESFEQHKDKVLAKLNEAVKEIKCDSVKISVIGHSLGGADAQRLVQNIVQIKAEPEKNSDGNAFNSIIVGSSYPIADCSALIGKKVDLKLNTSAAPMLSKEKGKQFARDLRKVTKKGALSLKATACVYQLDMVPTFGEQHLLAHRGAELCLWSELLHSGQEPQAGKIYLARLPDGHLEFLMKGENEKVAKGILKKITVEEPLTNDVIMAKRSEILEAAAEQELTTCDVMSLCEEATVAHVKANPFQHESTIFTKVGELAKKGIEILHTKKTDLSSDNKTDQQVRLAAVEKTKKEARMARVLNRSSGIDRLSFIKYVKEAIKDLAIKLSEDVAKIYAESQSGSRLSNSR